MNEELLTFTNCKHTKAELLASLHRHAATDAITQGVYWEGGEGCAVGCSIRDFAPGKESNHSLYELLFGIPEELALLEDKIFESLPFEKAKEWPIRFAEAIPEGVSLTIPLAKFKRFLLTDVCRFDREESPDVARAADAVIALLDRRIAGDEPSPEEWLAARSAAWSAESAALSAESAAWSAARSAAWSAAWSAESAVWSAAESAAWSAAESAESAAWEQIADKLIELLKEAEQ